MKQRSSTAWFTSAGLFFLAAIISMVADGGITALDSMWLCLGLTQLCLGIINRRRENEEHKD